MEYFTLGEEKKKGIRLRFDDDSVGAMFRHEKGRKRKPRNEKHMGFIISIFTCFESVYTGTLRELFDDDVDVHA